MAKVNIGGTEHDSFYRYKRDMIATDKSGKGMWKITNIDDICRQLKVGPEFLNKFYTEVKRRGIAMIGRGNFRGVISIAELEKILEKLISKYILCPKCRLPEWNGEFCSACGETKAIKIIKQEEDKFKCTHCKQAVKYVYELYDKRNAADVDSNIDKIIDYFWNIPSCDSGEISEQQCKRKNDDFCQRFENTFHM